MVDPRVMVLLCVLEPSKHLNQPASASNRLPVFTRALDLQVTEAITCEQERCKEAVLPVVLGRRAIAIQKFVVMPEKSLSDLKNLKPSVRGKSLCPLQAKCLSSLEVNIPCGVSEIVTQCQMPFLSSNHALSNYMCSERPALRCFGLQSVSEGHELQRLICFGFLSSYAQSHGNTRVFHLQVCSNTRFLPRTS